MTEILNIKQAVEDSILKIPGVAGIGITRGSPERIRVYVEKVVPEVLAKIPETIGGFDVEVIESGKFVALEAIVEPAVEPVYRPLLARTDRWRPSPGGVSIGHFNVTAGTLSTRVFDATTGEILILSNNHVLANCDSIQNERAREGDSLLQPGSYDGGTDPADRLATLHRWIKIDEPGENIVDCALGLPLNADDVADDILEIGVVTEMVEAEVDMSVKKSGRTTGLNTGTILDTNATVRVGYRYFVTTCKDQIITSWMAAGGDSGSLLCDENDRAVGLLFAGSSTLTVHNKITNVARELGIEFAPPPPPPPPVLAGLPLIMVGGIVTGSIFGWLLGVD